MTGFAEQPPITADGRLLTELLIVGVSGGLSALVFMVLAFYFRVEELRWLMDIVRRKLSR